MAKRSKSVNTITKLQDGVAEIFAREKALAPLAREYEEIKTAADALRQAGFREDGSVNADPSMVSLAAASSSRRPSPKRTSASRKRPARRSAKKRTIAGKGERAEQIVKLVRRSPGLTTMQVAEQLGLTIANAQFHVRNLINDNQVTRDSDRGLHAVEPTAQAASSGSETDTLSVSGGGDGNGSAPAEADLAGKQLEAESAGV